MPILEFNAGHSAARYVLLISAFGVVFGLFFGLPPAYAGHAMGLSFMPFGAGAILMGLFVGILLAFLCVTFLTSFSVPHIQVIVSPNIHAPRPVLRKRVMTALACRLAEEKARLDCLDEQRESRNDRGFEKLTEQRIVWGELLDLELQDIDEQMTQICRHAAEGKQEFKI